MTTLRIGDLLDKKYRLVRSLGRGAWGDVWEGVDESAGRRLVLTVLHREHLGQADTVERFEREARAAMTIDSPNIVRVLDMGKLGDARPYVAMELWEGEDLGQQIAATGVVDSREAAIIGVQVLAGLSAAHAVGVVHGDVRPDNIVLVRTRGELVAKLVGFGTSKPGGSRYASPEQCEPGRSVDARTDLYSLGVVLYEAVTGRRPHEAASFSELASKVRSQDCPDIHTHRKGIDSEFADAVMVALQREPGHRFQSAEEFKGELAHTLTSQGVSQAEWRLARKPGDTARTQTPIPVSAVQSTAPHAASVAPRRTRRSAYESLPPSAMDRERAPRRPMQAVVMLLLSIGLLGAAVYMLPAVDGPTAPAKARISAGAKLAPVAAAPPAAPPPAMEPSAAVQNAAPSPPASVASERVVEPTVVDARPDAGRGAIESHGIRATF